MRRVHTIAAVVILLAASTLWAAEDTRWINARITEPESETNVEVHLPLDLVITILEGVEVENFHYGKVEIDIDDVEIDWPAVLVGLKDAPDGEFINAVTEDGDVRISKTKGMVYILAKEKGDDNAEVEVRLPMGLLDALHVDEQNQIDVVALLASIETLPDGELVRVTADDANVRIWVE